MGLGAYSIALLLLLSLSGDAAANAHDYCGFPDSSRSSKSGCLQLPLGVCLWKPNTERCPFEVMDAEFLEVIGSSPKVEFIGNAPADEGGVYFPDTEEFYFSSTWSLKELPDKPTTLMKLSLNTLETSVVMDTVMANGMVLDNNGDLLLCEQGLFSQPGFVRRVNLHNLSVDIVADNWNGVQFNSPNDAVVKSDGSIWFTDPNYGQTQGFKGPPLLPNQVYRVSTEGEVTVVADGFAKPNGLAFSPDETLLYITDTGSSIGDGTVDLAKPHSITVFDVEGDTLKNRRLFACVTDLNGDYAAIAVPDGIKLDTAGRVYVANSDGIQVFSPSGTLLGLIRTPGRSINMGFVGPQLSRMIMTNKTSLHSVQLAVEGAGLLYAKQFHHLLNH